MPWKILPTAPPVGRDAGLGTDDPRVTFLRTGPTEALLGLLGEILDSESIGCSPNFFMIGMNPRFRTTEPEQLFDLIVGALRERVPNKNAVPQSEE